MLTIALNPGLVMLFGAAVIGFAPANWRSPLMALSAIGALLLLLAPDFGRYDAFAQIGLVMVPLRLDALSYMFGLGFIAIAVLIALFGAARRYESIGILLLAGAATSALFVGDLVSFVAAAALAGLAAAFLLFCVARSRAQRAGVQMLIWQGLEGLLLLSGAAFLLSGGLRNEFGPTDWRSAGGALLLAGFLLRVGAPLAHVWIKDAIGEAFPTSGAALAAFAPMLGLYGLARAFSDAEILAPIGLSMIGLGALYACIETDLRRAFAAALTAQLGVAVALIGMGGPAAIAAAGAHSFAILLSFCALFAALGVVRENAGSARAADLAGWGPRMPIATTLLCLAGLSVSAAPGFATYASFVSALDAARGQGVWAAPALFAFQLLCALSIASVALRPVLALITPGPPGARARRADVFGMLLGSGLALFLSVLIAAAPQWLFALAPGTPALSAPYALSPMAQQIALCAGAGATYLAIRLFGAGKERALRMLDMDAFYEGPLAAFVRWMGAAAMQVYAAWRAQANETGRRAAALGLRLAEASDRPYRERFSTSAALFAITAFVAAVCLQLL